MARITGWKGVVKPKGSLYPRYVRRSNGRKGGIEYRDRNTGAVFDSKGRLKGYEVAYQHISGHDSKNETGIGLKSPSMVKKRTEFRRHG